LAYKGCFIIGRSTCILPEEGIQSEGFRNLWKEIVSCRDQALSSSLCFEGSDVNEEINNMMDGIPEDESNGYKCNSFDDATNDGTLNFFKKKFMSEGTNEEGNAKAKEE
jgi:hypothetical protein